MQTARLAALLLAFWAAAAVADAALVHHAERSRPVLPQRFPGP